MTTLKDVAKKAKVSIKTVSRVINHEQTGVSETTREHVWNVIHELGYVPNLAAQRLKSGKAKTLALVLPRVTSPYAVRLLSSVLSAARDVGYSVLLLEENPNEQASLFQIKNIIRNQQADGLIIAPPGGDHPALMRFVQENDVPHIIITPRHVVDNQVSVEATDREGAREATKYLLTLSHTEIVHITCPLEERFSHERLNGYKEALEEAGLPINENLIFEGDNTTQTAHNIVVDLLRQDNYPTAFFAGNDEMAVGIMIAAWQMGFHVPRDISVVGFDDAPIAQQVFPTLTTVAQPIDDIAKFSVERLIHHIEAQATESAHTRIPTRLVLRNSCAIPSIDGRT